MGASRAWHRLSTPAALALVLALAGSTSPTNRADAAGSAGLTAGATVGVATDAGPQPSASLTAVEPYQYPVPIEVTTPEPAVRIAATGNPAGTTVRADIADVLLQAYRSASAGSPATCNLPVSLLAAIGQVESGSLVGRPIDAEHRTSVLGPLLDGNGFAAIPDTDRGRWDGDTTWDRAVGPMQFIPSTWSGFGVDGDGDGEANPQDVEDAAAGTAAYLCYGGRDLSRPADLRSAVLSYNHSQAYLRLVLTYQQRYAGLGLDSGTVVKGLPTAIALTATPITPDGWQARAVEKHRAAKATKTARASAKSQKPRPVKRAPGGAAGQPAKGSTSPATPGGTDTPDTDTPDTPDTTDTDTDTDTTDTDTDPPDTDTQGGSVTSGGCPTEPPLPDAPPVSDEVIAQLNPDGTPTCPPCPPDTSPTLERPCWPVPAGVTPSEPAATTEAAAEPVTPTAAASPSSAP